MFDPLDLTKLTPGDRLRLWRWRRDLSQRRGARLLGTTRTTIQKIEADGALTFEMSAALGRLLQRSRHIALSRFQGCRLARHRLRGWGLAAAARELGVSRVTYLAWERAADLRVVNLLKSKGFTGLK